MKHRLLSLLESLAVLAAILATLPSHAAATPASPEPVTCSLGIGAAAMGYGAWRKRRKARLDRR